MSDEKINSAMEESRIFLKDTAKRLEYLNQQMAVWDYNSRMANKYEEGREEGENNIILLSKKLISQDRIEDLERACEDKQYRKQLKKEFGIS